MISWVTLVRGVFFEKKRGVICALKRRLGDRFHARTHAMQRSVKLAGKLVAVKRPSRTYPNCKLLTNADGWADGHA